MFTKYKANIEKRKRSTTEVDIGIGNLLATKSPSSLSYTIAALNPAVCALLTLSSKLHPPLMIKTNGDLLLPLIELVTFFSGEQASRGSATYKVPHSPDPFTDGAEIIKPTKIN